MKKFIVVIFSLINLIACSKKENTTISGETTNNLISKPQSSPGEATEKSITPPKADENVMSVQAQMEVKLKKMKEATEKEKK